MLLIISHRWQWQICGTCPLKFFGHTLNEIEVNFSGLLWWPRFDRSPSENWTESESQNFAHRYSLTTVDFFWHFRILSAHGNTVCLLAKVNIMKQAQRRLVWFAWRMEAVLNHKPPCSSCVRMHVGGINLTSTCFCFASSVLCWYNFWKIMVLLIKRICKFVMIEKIKESACYNDGYST